VDRQGASPALRLLDELMSILDASEGASVGQLGVVRAEG
jgi:hypothetical protein